MYTVFTKVSRIVRVCRDSCQVIPLLPKDMPDGNDVIGWLYTF